MTFRRRVRANLALVDEYGDPALRWLRERGKSLATIADPVVFVPSYDRLHDRWRAEKLRKAAA